MQNNAISRAFTEIAIFPLYVSHSECNFTGTISGTTFGRKCGNPGGFYSRERADNGFLKPAKDAANPCIHEGGIEKLLYVPPDLSRF